MFDVLFPTMSTKVDDADGVVATWFVREGEQVELDQLIAEVQMDKVSADVVAPAAGTVSLLVEEEVSVIQGTVIARINAG